ncbi:MAG: hypothetical protein KDG52_19165 [Rhodocyclaceae bacterium]|nr:hypothetical protein [Rhodocyclaceae bacterium]
MNRLDAGVEARSLNVQVARMAPRLQKMGVSPLGARQVLTGQVVTDQNDRKLIARIVLTVMDGAREEGNKFVVTQIDHW